MILHKERLNIEGGFTPRREKTFGIAPAMLGHVMKIMSDMYSDPYKAIAREYIANAVDSHRSARRLGRTIPKPIQVWTPSRLHPTFSVRDYGIGMTEDETEELLSNFGSSGDDKRVDDSQIGGFGIGSKCAFAVSDSYTFTVWHGGRERVWICTIKQDAARSIQQLSDQPSNEPTGVRVDVPVNWDQAINVVAGVQYVLSCLNEPIELDGEMYKSIEWKDAKLAPGIQIIYHSEKITQPIDVSNKLVCGDFYYDLSSSALNSAVGYEGRQFFSELIKLGQKSGIPNLDVTQTPVLVALTNPVCCLRFDAGSLRPAPNRENIIFDAAAIHKLKLAHQALHDSLTKELGVITASAKTPLDVLRLVRSLNDTAIARVKVQPIWNGKKIEYSDLPAMDNTLPVFFPHVRRKRRSSTNTWGVKTESVAAKIKEESGWPVSDRSDVKRLLRRGTVEADSKIFTTDQFVALEAEPMGLTQLGQACRTWWENQIEALRQKGVQSYNPLELVDLNSNYIIVMGTEEERKVKIQELSWCVKDREKTVLVRPPKVPRAPRGDGETKESSEAVSNRGWLVASSGGWEKSFRPKAGTKDDPARVVYVVARPADSEAQNLVRLHDLWDVAVPDYKRTKVYALTEDAFARAKENDKYRFVPLHDAMEEWLNTWCESDSELECFGAEMQVLFGRMRLANDPEDLNDESVDRWGFTDLNDFIEFVDEREDGKWWKPTVTKKGDIKELIDRILLRAGPKIGTRDGSVAFRITQHYTLVSATLGFCGGDFTLRPAALTMLKSNVTTLRESLKKLLEDKPERAALIARTHGFYRKEPGKPTLWNKEVLEKLNG